MLDLKAEGIDAAKGPAAEETPFELFEQWITEAGRQEINDPNAMALATAGEDALPDVRMVLLKEYDTEGFVFFTNTQSNKGAELAANMQASAVLHWKSMRRQVRFRGPVEAVTEAEADAYFVSRAPDSRIGAWASRQSRPLGSRRELDEAVAREGARFGDSEVPRPPYWSGYRIRPTYIEFWSDRPFRLHDRFVFSRQKPEGPWHLGRLYP
ncbi:pyridoxine/pyridoxamine 5'-phosphate oxidase [Streptomyces inusitatus]|uniref:Pyridoxine/pyridoxamine 5'-phosphate oxidase n=1 Tax=Streptomyces inusitatus TaxID=68221 RepID=A0A918Q020_9ACTN|nr:pyridoxamine 5'-phosphate oxidase [Streptomyces inusitatus]GGZ28725.1 pyridoxine/pyridoxamine 5'-phosphate oxidase [Streptomyces inusitatus]